MSSSLTPLRVLGLLARSTVHSRTTISGLCLVIKGQHLFKSLYQGTGWLSQKYSCSSRIGSRGRPVSFGLFPPVLCIACRVCFCSPIVTTMTSHPTLCTPSCAYTQPCSPRTRPIPTRSTPRPSRPLSLPSCALRSICDAYVSAHDALLFLSISREHR